MKSLLSVLILGASATFLAGCAASTVNDTDDYGTSYSSDTGIYDDFSSSTVNAFTGSIMDMSSSSLMMDGNY